MPGRSYRMQESAQARAKAAATTKTPKPEATP